MNIATQLSYRDEEFTGLGRLFPLPNLVMFPHVVQALHVFEPRYQRLLDDALAADSLIVLATSLTDAPGECCCRPPIAPVACLTRVVSTRTLSDGRSDILVLGLRRVHITFELPLVRPYREAEMELLADTTAAEGGGPVVQVLQVLQDLIGVMERLYSRNQSQDETLAKILNEPHSLSIITDLLGYSLPLTRETKLALLGETNVYQRAIRLRDALDACGPDVQGSAQRPFPPRFSGN